MVLQKNSLLSVFGTYMCLALIYFTKSLTAYKVYLLKSMLRMLSGYIWTFE